MQLREYGTGRCAASNVEFVAIEWATGHVTDAERFGWSYVFGTLLPEVGANRPVPSGAPWWRAVEGASWQAPEGPGSGLVARLDHPVIPRSRNDEQACAGGRLPSGAQCPSGAQWENAAKGDPVLRFLWDDEEPDDESVIRCNLWQGSSPDQNTLRDGDLATTPVRSLEPNGFGLYNMAGSVGEWCADALRVRSLSLAAKERNAAAYREDERLLKGGSCLCHFHYRDRVAARSDRSRHTSAGNTGFRLAFGADRMRDG